MGGLAHGAQLAGMAIIITITRREWWMKNM
jgi:hypothetical protein